MKKTLRLLVVMLAAQLSVQAQINLNTGLVAKYYFDGNANDQSGNGHNCTVVGATLTADRFGRANKAYLFNGTTNFLTGSDQGFPTGTSDRSITFWAKPSAVDNSYRMVMGYGQYTPGSYYACGIFNTNNTYFVSTHTYDMYADPARVDSQVFIAVVRENSVTRMFINGVYASGAAITTNTQLDTFFIGRDLGGASFFKGVIDDIRIYNRAINNNEIGALYNEQPPTEVHEISTGLANIMITPNPSNGKFTVNFMTTAPQHVTTEVFSALGAKIYTTAQQFPAGKSSAVLDLGHVAPGQYHVVVRSESGMLSSRMVIQK